MTTKLAQQKSHCFKLMKPLKLQQKDGEMYSKIEYLDLIFREFKMHDHCWKTFLKGFGEKHRHSTKAGGPKG